MNKPLTPKEAKTLKFPCLLEVWDYDRMENAPIHLIVESFENSKFKSSYDSTWIQAALPNTYITEAMHKQFSTESKFTDETIKYFNADKAQKMSVNNIPEKLYKYLSEIKKAAEKGERFLYVFEPLEDFTHLGLTSRGFTLIDHSDATIRTKGLYCTIKW